MKRSFLLFSLLALSSNPCLASLSGTITDRKGNGLADVNVLLVSTGTTTTTDAHGAWSLGASGVIAPGKPASSIRWTGSAVEGNLEKPSTVSVEAYDQNGALLGLLTPVRKQAGRYSLPLKLAHRGFAWLRVVVDGHARTLFAALDGSRSAVASGPFAARSQGIVDTLRFVRRSRVVANVPTTRIDTSGIVVRIDTSDAGWNESISYGDLYDARDGQVYRTTKIGTQVWMAENLYWDGSGACPLVFRSTVEGIPDSCVKYGRLYTWAEAMASTKSPIGMQLICPTGWHVPTNAEWITLVNKVEDDPRIGIAKAATALASRNGWRSLNGTDLLGFRALPAGLSYHGSIDTVGYDANFWSSTAYDGPSAMMFDFQPGGDLRIENGKKEQSFSLRCLEGVGDSIVSAHDSSLLSLSVSAGQSSPVFSSSTLVYTDTVDYWITSLTVKAVASDATSFVHYDLGNGYYTSVSAPAALAAGVVTKIAIKVSTTNSTSLVYHVDVFRKADPPVGDTGSFRDVRDDQVYRTVKIGSQTWMAQNLDFKPAGADSGTCYGNRADLCRKYGRLYDWNTVMSKAASSSKNPSGVQGICPADWHVPSDTEWTVLVSTIEADPRVGTGNGATALKSRAGWTNSGNGIDLFGFGALPAGYSTGASSWDMATTGYFWSATQDWYRLFAYPYAYVTRSNQSSPTLEYSLRCVGN